MKIVSWNVNGLRSICRKGNWSWFLEEKPDVFCIQETKCSPDQLSEEVLNVLGYSSFFSYSRVRKGYSGVATYSKIFPVKFEEGLGINEFDDEGRVVSMFLKKLAILNVYFPNGGGGSERLKYKLRFYDAFLKYIKNLEKNGFSVIFCGDVNTAHHAIDLARPKENEKNTGFLPEERAWLDMVQDSGFIDVWRYLNPDKANSYTYWDMKTFARDRNVGWRIDYFFVSSDLKDRIVDCHILDNIFGSDHCPISLDITY